MIEYLRLTLLANAGESEPAFNGRLAAFWTHMIRNRPDDYERVYSEAVAFEVEGGRLCRRYMIEPEAIEPLGTELATHAIAFEEVDADDLYSKAEAASSEWFQIDH